MAKAELGSNGVARRWVASAVVLVTMAAFLQVFGVQPASASSLPTTAEADLLGRVNADRSKSNLGRLADDGAAAAIARRWAQHMAAVQKLEHNPNLSGDVSREVTDKWTRIGENVGSGNQASSLYEAFMRSSAHRANILGDFNRIGMGAYRDDGGTLWVTMVFVKGPAVARAASAEFASFSEAVQRQYLDFLGRGSDMSGLGFWHTSLTSGADEAAMVESFLSSPEFGATARPVVRLYLAYFDRIPDYGGLTYWIGAHRGGRSLVSISDEFARSDEFKAKYGSLSDDGFVEQVYRSVLGRAPDADGKAYWTDQLRKGKVTRGGVMLNFSDSNEYASRTSANVDVIVTYVGMLRRSPDSNGYSYWAGRAKQGGGLRQLIAGFLASSEYASRTNTNSA